MLVILRLERTRDWLRALVWLWYGEVVEEQSNIYKSRENARTRSHESRTSAHYIPLLGKAKVYDTLTELICHDLHYVGIITFRQV